MFMPKNTRMGVLAADQITRIELIETEASQGELLYELSFSQCGNLVRPIPTLSEWGTHSSGGSNRDNRFIGYPQKKGGSLIRD